MKIEKTLFDETKLKSINLKNRFFHGAIAKGKSTEDGHCTSELYRIYEDLAKGGVALINTGYTYIRNDEHPVPNMEGIYNDTFISEYKVMTNIVHQYDSKIVMQLVYGGSITRLNPPSSHIWGPSAIENPSTKITPIEMNIEDIHELIEDFAQAARRAKEAGFDGVVIHGAHGYLINQFLSPYFNRRNDEYGGIIENRVRIIVEIIAAMRKYVGEDYLIMLKINSCDYFDGGLTEDDCLKAIHFLADNGLDAVEVSGGNPGILSVKENNLGSTRTHILKAEQEAYFQDFAIKLANQIKIPVILIGGLRSYNVIDHLLKESDIQYFSLARPLICEPNLVHLFENQSSLKAKCLSCNQCYSTQGKDCILHKKER